MAATIRAAGGTPGAPTLSSTLLARVREAIMRGDHPPGTKLHLAGLRESLGVSLSPLREALCRLESEGLVTIEDQRGYRVAAVSLANCAEVIALRVELEGMALRRAIERGDVAWEGEVLAALHRLNAQGRGQGRDHGRGHRSPVEQDRWEAAHRRFHAVLIEASGMPLLQQFCSHLHDQSDRYRRIFLRGHAPDRDVPAEHAALADAAIGRRTDEAARLLRDHVERTGRNVMRVLAAGDQR